MIDAALQSLLFRLDPEDAHRAALRLLGVAGCTGAGRAALRAAYGAAERPVEVLGLRFPNAVGLAAGYDKDGTAWRALAALGFGHVEVGTVTPLPQAGNPRPRVFRLAEERAIINRMGFPSEGADMVRTRLHTDRPYGVVLGVNLGKNKDTPLEEAARDYVAGVRRFAEVADYLAVNVSSPNTPGLRSLQGREALRALLAAVVAARDAEAARRPVLVKLAPDLDDAGLDDACDAALSAGVDGVIATNTTLARDGVRSTEAGGLSGAPLTARALATLGGLRARLPGTVPVIAAGGIMSADDARARLDAGAALVQLYTGFVYGGPSLVQRVARA
jgi:dihydroorotate dehydrogenase